MAAELPGLLDRIRAAGLAQNMLVGLAQSVVLRATLGDVDAAARDLEAAHRAEDEAGGGATARLALAEAALLAASGDEARATEVLEAAIGAYGLGVGSERRPWRTALPLTYVLVPGSRPTWDAADVTGHVAEARALARAVAGLRDGDDRALGALVADGVPQVGVIRGALLPTFGVELAVGLHACGRPEGRTLLEALGEPGGSPPGA